MTSEQVDVAVASALDNGYRHIDTAFLYNNEKYIGNSLKKWFASGNRRDDVFITSKVDTDFYFCARDQFLSEVLPLKFIYLFIYFL